MYLILKDDILNLACKLSTAYELYGPQIDRGTAQTFFDRTEYAHEISLSAPIPSNPPKVVVLPQIQRIMSYSYDRTTKHVAIQPEYHEKPKALFGLRSCDLNGLLCLDRFFLGQKFVDEFYRRRRKNMFLVTNTCTMPFRHCFCVCTDSGPAAAEGFDLNLTDLGEHYLVEAGSSKGREFMEKLGCDRATGAHVAEKQAQIARSIRCFEGLATESRAWLSRVINRVTTGFIREAIWEYIGHQCLECGACTFVCPTCSCFNVVDACNWQCTYERLRTWDSCAYEGYSRMAGGHNPRKPVEDRRNKRFSCKLSYSQIKKYLRPSCVGCGRCAWVCPGDIGMPNVVKYIRREIQTQVTP